MPLPRLLLRRTLLIRAMTTTTTTTTTTGVAALRPPRPLIFVVGSTGTGKSDLAVELALRHGGEIINADAMQMYRGLPILTNQLSDPERRGVPHHLLGHVDVDEPPWTVVDFCCAAERLIREIRARGKVPIVVGGTTYYVCGLLLDGAVVREGSLDGEEDEGQSGGNHELDLSELDDVSTESLFARLQAVDPVMAAKWQPNDRRKIHRSLEIYLRTGRRASDIYAEQQDRKAERDSTTPLTRLGEPLLFWVCAEPEALKARLDRRVDKMLGVGLVDELTTMAEVKRCREEEGRPVDATMGIWQSIGVKQLLPYLEALRKQAAGGVDAPSAHTLERLKQTGLEEMKTATRQYAKYQTRFIKSKLVPHLIDHAPNAAATPSTTPTATTTTTTTTTAPPPRRPHLFVLDSTDQSSWPTHVSAPALSISTSFLNGQPLPSPPSLSPLASAVLANSAKAVADLAAAVPCRRWCELCDVTCTTEALWEVHVKGRAHRQAQKRKYRRMLVVVEKQNPTDAGEEGKATEVDWDLGGALPELAQDRDL